VCLVYGAITVAKLETEPAITNKIFIELEGRTKTT
jgi:hypothetical protein